MRNYSNMPILDWNDEQSAKKAEAQILHQEPVILQMPAEFDAIVNEDNSGCERDQGSAVYADCDGGELLKALARQNSLPGLNAIADACARTSSRVDIDPVARRIIIHD